MNPLDFIKFTPKTNCGECNHPTCLAFAVAVTKGGADPALCPYIDQEELPQELIRSKTGEGIESVNRGQVKRDLALVTHLKSKIKNVDFGKVASTLGAKWNPDDPDLLSFVYLGRNIDLRKDSLYMDGTTLVDPRDQILLYNYVSFDGGTAPENDWVGMESLPNSISKVRTLAAYCEQPLARRFKGRPQRLGEISRTVGSFIPQDKIGADVAVIIPVLPCIPVYLLFWDEEPEDGFDSRVKVLFDRHVLDFLDIESLVFCAERMAERIVELDS